MIIRFFYTLKQAFLQVLRNRAMSLTSIFAITAMFLLLSIFFIAVININTAAQSIQNEYDSIEIFLKDDITEEDKAFVVEDIKKQKGVEDSVYKSREDAMKEFKERWGKNAYLLNSLKDNPLPNSVVVYIDDLEYAEDISNKAAGYNGVEDVKFFKDTVDKLLRLTKFIQLAAIVLMILIIVISVVIVSNTIKLTVFNRAGEISIMKYVGATNWFIRGPFLAEGIIIGIISAGISVGISAVMYEKLMGLIGPQILATLSMTMVPAGFMTYNFLWIFLSLGISIGACGSIVSMKKFLNA